MIPRDPGEDAPLLLHSGASSSGGSNPPPPLPPPPALSTAGPLSLEVVPHSARTDDKAKTSQQVVLTASSASINAAPRGAPPASAAKGSLHPAGTPWGLTAGLLLADMFGIGALSLPSVFARLGWLVSFVLLLLFGLGCGYLGVLFSKLAVALPGAATMDEIGAAALGTTGRRLVYAVVYTTILVDPIALHITCMLALQQVFPGLGMVAASAVIALLMLPLAQIQNLHDVGWMSLAATGCMIFAVFATLIKLLAMPGDQLAFTSLLPPPKTRAIEGLIAALNLSFAFGGQVNWMRYVSGMAHREEFRFAAEVADGLMSVFYVLLGVTAYSKLGPRFDHSKPITSVLPPGLVSRAINVALLARCLVAYCLNSNVFTDLLVRVGRPWLSRLEDACPWLGRKASWGLLSCLCITTSALVAAAVPKFDLAVAMIAAVGDVAAPYTLPALFGLVLLPGIQLWEKTLLKLLVPVSLLLPAFGLYASGYALVESLLRG